MNNNALRSTLILFDQSKNEEFTLLTGLRQLHKRLRNQWQVEAHTNEELTPASFDRCQIFVLPSPRARFSEEEFAVLKQFLESGGSVLVMLSEGGEQKAHTNINFFLEEYGIACNPDAVIRTIFYKYFDPKEALVSNGILNRSIAVEAGIGLKTSTTTTTQHRPTSRMISSAGQKKWRTSFDSSAFNLQNDDEDGTANNNQAALSFVYPYGATLNVNRNSTPVLSTGTVCYPISRPICAFHACEKEGGGKLAVIGSAHMFTDEYLLKEDNIKIFDVILKFLAEGFELNPIDAADPDLADAHTIPDNINLSGQLKMCLQESELEQTFFGDFTKLFDTSIQSIGLENWAEAIRTYERLGLKHEPLTLVTPAFQVPMPPFEPAVFPPHFRELPPPELELFDLDDAFSSNEVQLAQLTNRCAESDLDLYIREAGEILGINKALSLSATTSTISQKSHTNSRKVLEYVVKHLIEWKKSGAQENGDDMPNTVFIQENESPTRGFQPIDENDEDEANYFSDIDQYDDI